MNNKKIRVALIEHNVKYYELAELLEVSQNTLCRRLRSELPEEEQNRIVALIAGRKQNG